MNSILSEIRQFLEKHKNEKALNAWRKSVLTAKKIHWVYLADINKMIWKWKNWWFELVEILWENSYLEEQLIATKILWKIWKKDPEKTLNLIKNFVNKIDNRAVCDTLATQWIRWIFKIKKKEIFDLAKKFIYQVDNLWIKRFWIVLLINFKKEEDFKDEIKRIIEDLKKENEYYIKKAVDWLKRLKRVRTWF